ncbi:response regulator transcription factor [Microbacterium protaetiae]|uniref:Response regulator transcription factor n=1 Tax=Microbacterium protaetiae TaxID=2509458 RepID=A0A4P6EBM5_9MICO|nr:response regulator transcription factor [Microbacterium protaetiae]QAY59602.1 response regulator transcription factor [Microbacterium protaetiae]
MTPDPQNDDRLPGDSAHGNTSPGATPPGASTHGATPPGASTHGATPPDAGDGHSGIRVIIADDQAVIRAGYATILGLHPDITVVGEAGDGRAAVELARRVRPDVIVMDVRMPVLDGIAATKILAGPGVDNPPRVLVVTTFALDRYVYDALRAGASGFLLKDSSAQQLVNAVRTIAAGESLLAPAVTQALLGRFAERVLPAAPRPDSDPRLARLTPREFEVLTAIAHGDSNAEIAHALVISHETVKTYVSRILLKLELRDRVHVVVYAYRNGLVTAQG